MASARLGGCRFPGRLRKEGHPRPLIVQGESQAPVAAHSCNASASSSRGPSDLTAAAVAIASQPDVGRERAEPPHSWRRGSLMGVCEQDPRAPRRTSPYPCVAGSRRRARDARPGSRTGLAATITACRREPRRAVGSRSYRTCRCGYRSARRGTPRAREPGLLHAADHRGQNSTER